MDVIATFAVCATVLAILERYAAPLFREWLEKRYPAPVMPETVKIPIDLIAWANGFGAQWAIDDARNFLVEEFERTKDWDLVRESARVRN